MSVGKPRRGRRRSQHHPLHLECLDSRVLLASGLAQHHLGAYLAQNSAAVRASSPAQLVDSHAASENLLSNLLGAGVTQIQDRLDALGTPPNAVVGLIVSNPLYHSILSRQDTYDLLTSPAINGLIGSQQVGTNQQSADSVTLVLPASSLLVIGTPTSLVEVPATAGSPGFFVDAPTNQILTLDNGFISVTIPRASLPAGVTLPGSTLVSTGTLSDVFAATGPLLVQTARSGVPQIAPNAPRNVPGLRLASLMVGNRSLATTGLGAWLRILHLAANRNVLTLDSGQQALVKNGLTQFQDAVKALAQVGEFQPAVPPPAPTLPAGPLNGTLEVSVGALRQLGSVDPLVSGLQLPGIGNFPGRIDVGFVFARNGDYGVALTARGPLSGNPPGLASKDLLGGDIRVEVSNAPSLPALNGERVVEGLTLGSLRMGDLQSSRTALGVSSVAASAGYGNGLEFGTGRAYTLVVPLGNVFALIPQAPPRRQG